jgi:hypothetical protein
MKAIAIILVALFAMPGGIATASACPGHRAKATHHSGGGSYGETTRTDDARRFWEKFGRDHG